MLIIWYVVDFMLAVIERTLRLLSIFENISKYFEEDTGCKHLLESGKMLCIEALLKFGKTLLKTLMVEYSFSEKGP